MRNESLFACGFLLFLVGCAEGSDFDEVGLGEGGGGGFGGADTGAGAGPWTEPAGGSGDTGGAGTGGGLGGDVGSGGAGSTCSYTAPNACASALGMPEIAGDSGAPMQIEQGSTSQWLAIQIRETQYDPIEQDEEPLSYLVKLESPPGMDYDLFVQEGPDDGGAVCNGTIKPGVEAGAIESVASTWADDISFGDDKDDHRWLSIEVRHMSGGECGPAAQWTLTVTRN